MRRVLTCIDAVALEGVLGRWLAAQQPPPAAPATSRRLQRAVAMEHANRAVLAQTDVEATTNEITRFGPCWRAWS